MIDDWRSLRNILCIRLDNMGDVLIASAALSAIRDSAPAARLSLLASSSGAAIAKMIPAVDETITYAAPWMKASGSPPCAADWEMIAKLHRHDFDAAIIFTTYSQSALPAAMLCRLAEIPRRLAYCRENPYDLLTHWILETEPQNGIRHEVRRQLDLVSEVGFTAVNEALSLQITPHGQAEARALIAAHDWRCEGPLIVVHPGATAASRRYPASRFAEALQMLTQRRPVRVVVTGDESERALVAEICASSGCRCLPLPGVLSLETFVALIGEASLLISNNTGPVHIAAAVGTPVVDLYALTNPQHTPWMVPHRVLSHDVPCKYCYKSICPEGHHDCLQRVMPSAVAEAAEALLIECANEGPARNSTSTASSLALE